MKKHVTIALDENLIKILDGIPKNEIPSRSFLIERLLWRFLENTDNAKSGSVQVLLQE